MDDPPAAATSLLDRLGAEPVPVEEPAHDEELLAATPLDGPVGLDRALEAEDPIDSDHTRVRQCGRPACTDSPSAPTRCL